MRMFLALSAGMLTCFGSPAAAQDPSIACAGEEPAHSLAEQVNGCTAILTAGIADPRQRAAIFGTRGGEYYELADYPRAVADYSEAIRLNPDDALTFYGRSYSQRALGHNKEAAADFARYEALQSRQK